VLFIYGNSSGKEVFFRQVQAVSRSGLARSCRTCPDTVVRTMPAIRNTYSCPGYARILARLMSELNYSSFHVVGWSLGGHIGLEMLARSPSVRLLLVTGTPPVSLDPAGVQAGFRWSGTTMLAGKRHFVREDVRKYLDAMMGLRIRYGHPLARSVARTDGSARFWMVRNGLAGVGSDEKRTVATSPRPLAIVQGKDDPFVRCDYLRYLSYANIWNGKPVFLPAGHAPHWQIPDAFNDNMMEFLRSVG
jgi:pimeloyl-ACP methyl ester carboxylesterase